MGWYDFWLRELSVMRVLVLEMKTRAGCYGNDIYAYKSSEWEIIGK